MVIKIFTEVRRTIRKQSENFNNNYTYKFSRGVQQQTVIWSVMSDSTTPWTIAHQAPLSMEFSRQEYWSG